MWWRNHNQFIAMDAAKKGAATCNAFCLEADSFIRPVGTFVFWKNAQPDTMRIGVSKDGADDRAKQPSVTEPGDAYASPANQADTLSHAGQWFEITNPRLS